MNVAKLPKVRDLTDQGRRLPIDTDGSPVYDMVLTIWSAFNEEEDHSAFELGSDWFSDVVDATPDDLRQELMVLGGPGCRDWMGLAAFIALSPPPHDMDSVLDWLTGIEPFELRRALLTYKCYFPSDDGEELTQRALRGDVEALQKMVPCDGTELQPEMVERYQEIFSLPAPEVRDRMVNALRRFRSEVYRRFEDDYGRATTRAAATRRALVQGADPETVIEQVTNGAAYRIQPGVARMVLVPSVVMRPWALIDQHRDVLVVAYPVPDEYLDADPDAPPSWLVKMHKALADDRRLRILRRLSEENAGLDDLSEMLGLTKSTVHHHVGLLRAAGLVRVHIDQGAGTKYYTLRETVLPDARQALDAYLRREEDNQISRGETK